MEDIDKKVIELEKRISELEKINNENKYTLSKLNQGVIIGYTIVNGRSEGSIIDIGAFFKEFANLSNKFNQFVYDLAVRK